ncbi:hypothetical protein MCELHM10_03374 [Paracoccaceae bacterium]
MSEPHQIPNGGSKRLAKIGIFGTICYLLAVFLLAPTLFYFGWLNLEPMGLNEIGDFLAGLFGPLAIFWLVLGFFQQGEELRNSVETLKLQAKELAASVEQQKELVQVTREQLEHERELLGLQLLDRKKLSQPDFILEFKAIVTRSDGSSRYTCAIVNTGNPVSRVELTVRNKDHVVVSGTWAFCGKGWGDNGLDAFGGAMVPNVVEPLVASISYVDSQDEHWEAAYDVIPADSTGNSVTFRTAFRDLTQLP